MHRSIFNRDTRRQTVNHTSLRRHGSREVEICDGRRRKNTTFFIQNTFFSRYLFLSVRVRRFWTAKWLREWRVFSSAQSKVPALKRYLSRNRGVPMASRRGQTFSCGFSYCAHFAPCGVPLFQLRLSALYLYMTANGLAIVKPRGGGGGGGAIIFASAVGGGGGWTTRVRVLIRIKYLRLSV